VRRQALQILSLALALAACAPAAAEAGTYHVYACNAGGASWGNRSWAGPLVPGLVVDTDCTPSGSLIGLRIDGGKPIANGASAALTFTSPPGTTIADFSLDRHLDFRSNPPLANTRPLYALYLLGGVPFAGAGDYHNGTRDRLQAYNGWYGHPAGNATLSRRTTALREFGALAGYAGDATTLSIQVGCFKRATDCSAPAGGRVYHVLYGVDVTIEDAQPPVPTVSAEGLLAGGPRNGSDPVVLGATDNAGIRRVELHDVTVPQAPQLVGAEDYTAARTDGGATCSARLAKTCPNLARELVRPTALQVGRRQLLVRTIDAAGNHTDRGPYAIDVVTPSDRGPLNGVGATETGTLTARFRGGRGQVRTARYGRRVRIAGTLVNAIGQPVAGAEIDLITTNKRRGAEPVKRKSFRTGQDGTFRGRTGARASRQLRLAWRSHVNDAHYSASDDLTLRTRAAATLRASTRQPRLGGRLVLRGRLLAPAAGVTVILQGRRVDGGRYTTFADTTTGRSGRFRVTYRFRDPGSRGRAFRFRAKLRAGNSYPFATGFSRRVTVRVR
jgi:hypothetical protein